MLEGSHSGNGHNRAPGIITRLGGSVGRVAAGIRRALRPPARDKQPSRFEGITPLPGTLIARTWWGTTRADDSDRYLAYLERTGLREYLATEGNRGVIALRRVADGRADFLLISFWESERAVRSFAGDRPERARFYPEDERYLLECDSDVTHYELVFDDRPVNAEAAHA